MVFGWLLEMVTLCFHSSSYIALNSTQKPTSRARRMLCFPRSRSCLLEDATSTSTTLHHAWQLKSCDGYLKISAITAPLTSSHWTPLIVSLLCVERVWARGKKMSVQLQRWTKEWNDGKIYQCKPGDRRKDFQDIWKSTRRCRWSQW